MRRLLLFAKRPRVGRVKTRLTPALSPADCTGLYRAFLADQVGFLRSLADSCEGEVCLDGPWSGDPQAFDGLRVSRQGTGDLGERLLRAFRRSSDEGASATLVVGADSPTLPAARVHHAFRALEAGASVVVSPAEDGGYVLLGTRGPYEELFRDLPWSGPRLLELTLERAAASGLELVRLEAWYDVDEPKDLERLRAELEDSRAARRAPATARFLARLDRSGSGVV